MYDEFLDGERSEEEIENAMKEAQAVEFKPKKEKTGLKVFFGIALGIVIGSLGCFIFISARLGGFSSSKNSSVMETITGGKSVSATDSKLAYLVKIIDNYYYKDVENQDMIDGIYKGLLESLDDPYSEYYTKEEYDELMVHLTGDYAGIGALLSKNKETGIVTITKVYSGTPAEKSGLKNGDIIVSADGFDGTELSLDEFVSHIRGEAGTDVTLLIYRDDKELEIVCTRDHVQTPTIEYQMLEGNTGYIQISQFTNSTAEDFKKAYEDLESQGMTQIIFDLRSNGGGLLDSVVEILDYLLPEGTVVYTEDKAGTRNDYTSSNAHSVSLPITVLVDGNTASAAEIFTGAIRDFKYGTTIGTLTFGKGIVQSTIPLNDGSAIKLTTSSYFTPSGECIQGIGIEPDIELEYEFLGGEDDEYSVELDNQIQKALEVLGVKAE